MGSDNATMKMSRKLLIFFALLLYVAAILYAKFLRPGIAPHEDASFNWIPFAIEYNSNAVTSLLLNALVFVPYGLLIAYIGKRALYFFGAGLVACFAIEFLQTVFHAGVFDITTIIADLIGMVAGYYVFRLVAGIICKGKTKKEAAA
jgi:glycopeptide antibiotics resistance protein